MNTAEIVVGQRVRNKFWHVEGVVLEVGCGGARLRYDDGGPFGKRGQRLGVWESAVDLEDAPG